MERAERPAAWRGRGALVDPTTGAAVALTLADMDVLRAVVAVLVIGFGLAIVALYGLLIATVRR